MYPTPKTMQNTAALPPKLTPAMANLNGRETTNAMRNENSMVASCRNESVMKPSGSAFLSHQASSGHQMDSDTSPKVPFDLKRVLPAVLS